MQLCEDFSEATYQIKAHEPGRILVNDAWLEKSFIIFPHLLITDWPPQQFADLNEGHFDALLQKPVDILLLGTGQQVHIPLPEHFAYLAMQGKTLEFMTTQAACRTYQILTAEGRSVGAALLIGAGPTQEKHLG